MPHITESQKGWGLKGPLKFSQHDFPPQAGPPRVSCPSPCPDYFHILQGWTLHNFPGSLCQCLATQYNKVFPDFQRESSVFQDVPIASFPVTGHQWKEPNPFLFALSLWVFTDIGKILLSALFPGWMVLALPAIPHIRYAPIS